MRKKYIGISGIIRKFLNLFVIVVFSLFFIFLDFENDIVGMILVILVGSFFMIPLLAELFLFDIYILDNKVFYTNYLVKEQLQPEEFISIKKIRFFPFLYKLRLHKQKRVFFSCVRFNPLRFSFFEDAVDFSEDYERVIKETFAKNEDF